ncbi:CubicO group peptidase (beta-lactamase class C family) [Sporosarcina luteola]|nr:CubicO group peptidase (beta-lactamase class C family) [Sporosarcina luteola]
MRKLLLCLVIVFLLIPANTFAKEKMLPSGMPIQDVEQTVDSIMEKYIGKDIPGLAIAIVQDGEIILLKGYGQSDIENNKPVDPEKTIFEAASVSKLYTWSAVMQLVEQGKIDLEADIKTYLPEDFLETTFDKKITMLDLMNHTAGFEDKAEHYFIFTPNELLSLDDYLTNEKQPKQVFKPGTNTAYSNYSTTLAGFIVQRVSGQPFEDYMQEHILEKLHMESSSFAQNYEQDKNMMAYKGYGYGKKGDQFEKKPSVYVNEAPAAALNTTASDLAYFMLAHLNQNQTGDYQLFQNKETLLTMHEQSYRSNAQLPGNAHGFWERFNGINRLIEHGGNLIGYTSLLSILPDQNFGLAILTNVEDEASSLRIDLYEALVGNKKESIPISTSANDDLVQGSYRAAKGIYSSFLSIAPIISSDLKIKKNEGGGIDVSVPGEEQPIHYVETAPFFYERVSDGMSLLDKQGVDVSRMAFEVDSEQNIIKMSFGTATDYLPVKLMDRASTNMLLIVIFLVVCLLYTLFFLFNWIKRVFKSRKGKVAALSTSYRFTAILAGVGLVVFVNNILLFLRTMSDPSQSLAPLRIHLGINWLLPLAIIVCGYFLLKHFKKATLAGKIFQLLLILISILFSLLLMKFHFLY